MNKERKNKNNDIKKNTPSPFTIPRFTQTNLTVHRQADGHMKSTLLLYPPSISTIKSGTVSL